MTSSCYILLAAGSRTSAQAQAYCQTQAAGSNLVSIHSDDEMDFVISMPSPNPPSRTIIIGLFRCGPLPPDFENYDGTPHDYDNFAPFAPDNNNGNEFTVLEYTRLSCFMSGCVNRGEWNDVTTGSIANFLVCKAPKL